MINRRIRPFTLAVPLTMLLLGGCCRRDDSDSKSRNIQTQSTKPHDAVVVADVVQNLGAYHGQRITVRGFVRMTFEGTAVFETSEDANKHGSGSGAALWLNVDPPVRDAAWLHGEGQKYHQKECIIEGVVNTNSHGHFGRYPATLDATGRILLVADAPEGAKKE